MSLAAGLDAEVLASYRASMENATSLGVFEITSTSATEPILASASPRNP